MKRLVRLTIILAGTIAVGVPALAAPRWPDSFSAYIAEVRETINTTDMDGYRATVDNPKGALLIDVREPFEYKTGFVPGTVNIPRGLLEFRIWQQLGHPDPVDMNTPIYVQCRTGGRATLAARDLQTIGFTNVTAAIVDLNEWQDQGHPFTEGEKPAAQ